MTYGDFSGQKHVVYQNWLNLIQKLQRNLVDVNFLDPVGSYQYGVKLWENIWFLF